MNAKRTPPGLGSGQSRTRLLAVGLGLTVVAVLGVSVAQGARGGVGSLDAVTAQTADGVVAVEAVGSGWLVKVVGPGGSTATAPVALAPPVVLTAAKLAAVQKKAESLAAHPIPTKIVSRNEVLRLARRYFPADQVGNAMAIAACESGQRSVRGATNSNGTTDWGIFQLNDGGTLQSSLAAIGKPADDKRAAQVAAMDAATNVRAAAKIYSSGGWGPWVCAYKQQIVAALWSNKPGPMAGKYSVIGVELPDAAPAKPKKKPAKPVVAAAKPTGKPAATGPTVQPAPVPDPSTSATPEPSTSVGSTASADPGASQLH
ncbi:MAG: hypothetical protein WCI74_15145 [Actinomycetes bacterium]